MYYGEVSASSMHHSIHISATILFYATGIYMKHCQSNFILVHTTPI